MTFAIYRAVERSLDRMFSKLGARLLGLHCSFLVLFRSGPHPHVIPDSKQMNKNVVMRKLINWESENE
jgi:hypothetical protein